LIEKRTILLKNSVCSRVPVVFGRQKGEALNGASLAGVCGGDVEGLK